ncbi:MAG: helix-turn-helix domain-containing protein [Acidobacteriaceae bacterium]|nr:helix-turn-helix domain-containing protein [Acidobacteriaceae bacterium]MBV9037322.1 helix-turn-helix domain-containing protein [Acidobacteriaceae bacterium]MBV9224646.1 helix-turn-helix domain-containing protein [Acidobacteriaceae bacterium]MBV9305944.1 helix-turn-helix domain-containing protein [Acidobacteriaceae bacterium]
MPVVDEKIYRQLVAEALPHVIHTEAENERCIAELEALHSREQLTPEEEQLAELLTLLVENFEDQHYQLKAAEPVAIVRELMDANGLKQADLLDIFGTRSVVSEVLNGKRELSKTHIEKLSQRFHVSPEVFFQL